MITTDEAEQLLTDGGHLRTTTDDFGPVIRILIDDYTNGPSFCTISSPTQRGRETLVALHKADLTGPDVIVPYSRHQITTAPGIRDGHELSTEEEDALFDYYQVPID